MNASQPKTKKKTTRRILVWLVFVALVAGGYAYLQFQRRVNAEKTLESLETVVLAPETLLSTINATGTVQARQSATLNWQTSGTIGQVMVQVGDTVAKGDVLMVLDETDLSLEVRQARLDQFNLEKSIAELDTNTDTQRAKLTSDLASGKAALATLEEQLKVWRARTCTEWNLRNLQQKYDDAYENYSNNPSEYNWNVLNQAKKSLDFCDPTVIGQKVSELQAQVDVQKQSIIQMEDRLETIASGPDPDELEKLNLQLAIVNKRLEATKIKSPMDGVVTSINGLSGDQVSVGKLAVQVDDLSELYVEVPIAEIDIPLIQVEQEAEMVFDAYYENKYSATVVEIDRTGTSMGGVVNYYVRLQVLPPFDDIKPDMTAAVTIIVGEKQDVWAVPSEAIVTRDGKQVVYVMRSGNPQSIEVTTGAYSDRKVEVISTGLINGDTILLNPPSETMEMFTNGNFRRP